MRLILLVRNLGYPFAARMLSTKFGYGRPAFLAAAFAAAFFTGVKALGFPMLLGRFFSQIGVAFMCDSNYKGWRYAAFSHLTQEQRNFCLSALNQSGQNLATALGPGPERIGCAIPVTPIGLHADGAALEVA